jgi:hypothetical protein
VILPGEMKDLMNKVTEAKKAAEANLIVRREETAAMRSQANTAKVLEGNPTLMRLRELEVLERVATSGKLNVVLGEKGLASGSISSWQGKSFRRPGNKCQASGVFMESSIGIDFATVSGTFLPQDTSIRLSGSWTPRCEQGSRHVPLSIRTDAHTASLAVRRHRPLPTENDGAACVPWLSASTVTPPRLRQRCQGPGHRDTGLFCCLWMAGGLP